MQNLTDTPQLISIGIIFNKARNKIYITQRLADADQGSLWEFPGGKVESNETIEEALSRELKEELSIQIERTPDAIEYFETINLVYTEKEKKQLQLIFYKIYNYEGSPYPLQSKQGKWVSIDQLNSYTFPKANHTILKRLTQELTDAQNHTQ